jgi:hypothetical protein
MTRQNSFQKIVAVGLGVMAALTLAIQTPDANALLMTGQDIIATPASVIDDTPGATNTHQQAFNEQQNVLLTTNLGIDGGSISSGTWVNSHMIFFNTQGNSTSTDANVKWTFDSIILGVMSDKPGNLEAASNGILGSLTTNYPGSFGTRGLEGADSYSVAGNMITLTMRVSEPGDWIRVVTQGSGSHSPVPEPGTILLLGTGLVGIVAWRRKKMAQPE